MPEKNGAREYFEKADVIMISISTDEVVTDINRKGCQILGYPKDEIVGKNWFEGFLPETARENVRSLFHEMLKGTLRHVHYEHSVVSKHGEERVFNWHNILASDETGNTIGMLSSGADVTERREAEKAKKETENSLQSTLDTMIEGSTIIDYDWRYVYMNDAYAKQERRAKEEFLGHTMMEMYPGIENTQVFGYLHRCMTERTPHQMETEFSFPDGSKRWFELRIEPAPIGIHIFSLDITERKKLEYNLRESEERFLFALKKTPVTVGNTDRALRFTWIYNLQLGYTSEYLIGKKFGTGMNLEDENGVIAYLKEVISKGIPSRRELRGRGPLGEKIFDFYFEPKRNLQNEITGLSFTALNITELKKAEEALRKSEEEYSSLFGNMMDGFAYCQMIFDEKGKPIDFVYLQINEAFEKITGLKRETIVGKKVTEAIPGTGKANPELFNIYGRVALTGKKEKFEIFFKPLSMWLNISVYCPQKGYFAAIFVDITERKKTEEELNKYRHRLEDAVAERTAEYAQANEKLTEEVEGHRKTEEGLMLRAMILDNTDSAIFLINSKGDFVYTNETASKIYGYSRDEFLNMNIRQLLRKQDAQLIDARIKEVFEKGRLELETVHMRKDQTLMTVQVSYRLIKTAHGQFIVSVMRSAPRLW